MVDTQLPIALPSDEELYVAFVDAIQNGVHQNIKSTVEKISGFIANAKDEIKNLVIVDPQQGLLLDMTIPKWDIVLASFVGKQWFLMRNALKILLASQWVSTFWAFVAKMKAATDDSVPVTIWTFSRIMTLFFENLGKKYATSETADTIHAKIAALFE